VANSLYAFGRQYILTGSFAGLTDTLKACLITNAYSPNLSTDQHLNNLGTARVGTDQTLTTVGVTNGFLTAANLTFPAVAGGSTVAYIAVYKLVGNGSSSDTTSPLIVLWDTATGLPVATGGTDITVTWNAQGLFRV
jgi:hypothetical protein